MMKQLACLLVVGAVLCSSSAFAQRSQLLALGKDNSAKISGTIQGKEYADYRVAVGAGQSVAVTLQPKSASVYFNFNPPKSDLSMYNGSTDGDTMAARMVPSSGEYIVRLYQMGAAADENRKGSFTLTVRVTGTALKPLPASVDATLPGTPYHAMGPVPCSIELEETRTSCDAYAIRYGDGSATVEFRAGTLIRRVLFLKGKPVASDSAETMAATREGDMTTVSFGEGPFESYRVPDALIYGG